MKKLRIHYLFRLAIFWLLFFAAFRVLFIMYHHAKIPDGKHSDTSLSLIYSIPMDLSILSFFLFVPMVLWSFQQFYKNRTIHLINKFYNYTLIICVTSICIFNIKFYGEYETLLSTEELAYLLYPKEAVTFLSIWSLLLLFSNVALFSFLAIRAYKKYLFNFSQPLENKMVRMLLMVILPVCLFILARGGVQARPLEANSAHYSAIRVNNDIATNPIWYLGYSFCNTTEKTE